MNRIARASLIVLLILVGAAAASFGGQKASFEALHIEKEASFELEGAPGDVFSLLEPLGRPRWVKSWTFEFLYPPSGEPRPGAVIRQTHRSGDGELLALKNTDGSTVWSHSVDGMPRGLGVADSVLYIGSLKGSVYALRYR